MRFNKKDLSLIKKVFNDYLSSINCMSEGCSFAEEAKRVRALMDDVINYCAEDYLEEKAEEFGKLTKWELGRSIALNSLEKL